MSLETEDLRRSTLERLDSIQKALEAQKKLCVYTALAVISMDTKDVSDNVRMGLVESLAQLAILDSSVHTIAKEMGFEL